MKKFLLFLVPFFLFAVFVTGCKKESKSISEDETYGTVTVSCDTVLYTHSGEKWEQSGTIKKGTKLDKLKDFITISGPVSDVQFPLPVLEDGSIFLVSVRHEKTKGYIDLRSCVFDDSLIDDCDTGTICGNPDYFIYNENMDILEYIRIICKRAKTDSDYYYNALDPLKMAIGVYQKRSLDFAPLAEVLIENCNGFFISDCFDVIKEDIKTCRFGADEDTIYALAVKRGNQKLFKTLVYNYLIEEDDEGKRRLDYNLVMYKNKAGLCLPEILAELNCREANFFLFPYRGNWYDLKIGYYENPWFEFESNLERKYASDEPLRECKFSDKAYVLEDTTITSVYGNKIKVRKGTVLSDVARVSGAAYTPDQENYYGIYYCKTENNFTGYILGDKIAQEKISVGLGLYFYRRLTVSKENDSVVIELYTDDFEKINFIRSVSPEVYQENLELNIYELCHGNGSGTDFTEFEIVDYGEHDFKGKKYRCLEFKYYYWKNFGDYDEPCRALCCEQFIALDEKKAVGYEVLDIKPFCLLTYERGFLVAKISWTFDERDRGVIEFDGMEYFYLDNILQTNKVKYTFKPVDEFYYDAPDFTATGRKYHD